MIDSSVSSPRGGSSKPISIVVQNTDPSGHWLSKYAPLATFLIAGVLPWLITPMQWDNVDATRAATTLVILYWAAARLSRSAFRGRDFLAPSLFWLYVYVWLGLAPFTQLLTGSTPLPYSLTTDDYLHANWIVIAGLTAYEAGFYISRGGSGALRTPASDGRIRLVGWVFVAISVAAVLRLGGPTIFLESRQALSEALFIDGASDKSRGALFSALATVPPFMGLFTLLLVRSLRGSRMPRLLTPTLVILNVVVNNPISQSRFWFTTVWGSILVALFWRKKGLFRVLPLAFVLVTVFLFPAADVFRMSAPSAHVVSVKTPSEQLSSKGDFDSFEQIAWGMKVQERLGFQNGRQTLGAVSFWIPRQFWNDKPRDTGILLAEAAAYSNTALSAPLWIESYFDGGLPLLAICFLLYGMVHRRQVALTSEGVPSFVIVGAFFQLVFLRGSLIQSMAFAAALFASYLCVTCRRKL